MNDLKDIKDSFLVKNTDNKDAKPIKVEKKVIENPENINTNKPSKVIVETKTYCNLVKLGKEGVPINYIPGDKNTLPINEISFFLSGGDFLHKKINILEETIMKNSEMYNFVIDKYEKDLKDLKEEMESIKNQHKLEIENLTKEKDNTLNQLNNLNCLKNNGQLEIEKLKQEINNHKTKYEELLNTKNILEKESNDYKNKISSENMKKNNEILELKKKIG